MSLTNMLLADASVSKGGPGSGPQGGKGGSHSPDLSGLKGKLRSTKVSHTLPTNTRNGRVSFSHVKDASTIRNHIESQGFRTGMIHRFGGTNTIQYEKK